MKYYCIQYINAGDGEKHTVAYADAEEAFIDLIDILDNPSNHDIECWIDKQNLFL